MDHSAQLTDALVGRYTIEREIGRGGMATVYLAHDVRHDREVALKVLDPELAAMLGMERFLSEIRVTAKLQHPNLLPLFDSGEANGLLFYVMPFVDGETLRARLVREKQLPVDDAVRIATAIATALDYAHSHGVIHRDLKPENILMQAGQPVIADFGIALAVSNAGGARMTQTGLSLGTPQYMSPEQATGERNIDARTDVYSLGAITYEMLAGEAPHTGASAQQVIARMMTEDAPHVSTIRRSVPEGIDAAVARALEKLPADRWSTARDFAAALSGAGGVTISGASSRVAKRKDASRRLPWGIAAACGVIAVIAIGVAAARAPTAWGASSSTPQTIAFALASGDSLPIAVSGIPFAISPDDRQVAYVGSASTGLAIYVRSLDSLQARQLAGTEGGIQPVFSPDSRMLAFAHEGILSIEPIGGGLVRNLVVLKGRDFAGANWVSADTMIASIGGALLAVPTNGGASVIIASPDTAQHEQRKWGPHALNDRFIAYVSVPDRGLRDNRVAVYDRRAKHSVITENLGTTVLGVLGDRLLWATYDGNVMAARFDRNGALSTPTRIMIESMLVGTGGAAKVTMSARGTLVYDRGTPGSQMVLVDDHGAGKPIVSEMHDYTHPRFSPDGSKVAVAILHSGGAEIWIADPKVNALSKFTTPGGTNDEPEWTADGKRITFYNSLNRSVLWAPTDGTDTATVLVSGDKHAYGALLTRDAKTTVFRTGDATSGYDIFYAPVATAGNASIPATAFANTAVVEVSPSISPDDKWVVYTSNESGRMEIYAKAFPGPGPRVQISLEGGTEPVWSRDGREIFYRIGRQLVAASVTASANTLTISDRRVLFEGMYATNVPGRDYDVAPDNKHFLMLQPAPRNVEAIVVYGWGNSLLKSWQK